MSFQNLCSQKPRTTTKLESIRKFVIIEDHKREKLHLETSPNELSPHLA